MDRKLIPTSLVPEIFIDQVQGDLQVKGWDRPEVAVEASSEDLSLDEGDDVVRLSCQGDCAIHLPYSASLKVESVHGDAHLKLLQDQLEIARVQGSLTLRSVAATRIGSINGDFSAKGISGSLNVEQIHGNAAVREVAGDCTLVEVQGNLDLRDIEGEIEASAEGNASLRLSQMSGLEYSLQAQGNISCLLPPDAGLRLRLVSKGELIKISLPAHTKTYRQRQLELSLGEGETSLAIQSHGIILLSSQPAVRDEGAAAGFDFGADFGSPQVAQQVEAQIAAQMDMVSRQMSERMDQLSQRISQSGLKQEEAERLMEQARAANERAASRAQEKMRRAQEKLERKLQATQQRNEAKMHQAERRAQQRSQQTWGFAWPPPPPVPPQPPKEPVSDEERLAILRMLEQKKISLEEAEQLLAALEGDE
jgi:hypothetical protein